MDIPFVCIESPDSHARALRRRLRRRMRAVAFGAACAVAASAAGGLTAYDAGGVLAAVATGLAGLVMTAQLVLRIDRRLIAPLQAQCQADFNRRLRWGPGGHGAGEAAEARRQAGRRPAA